jgi:hypothetical protein
MKSCCHRHVREASALVFPLAQPATGHGPAPPPGSISALCLLWSAGRAPVFTEPRNTPFSSREAGNFDGNLLSNLRLFDGQFRFAHITANEFGLAIHDHFRCVRTRQHESGGVGALPLRQDGGSACSLSTMICAPGRAGALSSRCNKASAGGQLEQPSEVNSSTKTGAGIEGAVSAANAQTDADRKTASDRCTV